MSEALALYRSIRRLHRRMSPALQFLGNQYLRDEFVRHKTAAPEHVTPFLRAWTSYRETLEQQLSSESTESKIGQKLDDIESLSDAQVGQLFALHEAATKGDDVPNKP